jgi:ribosomal protein S27AE
MVGRIIRTGLPTDGLTTIKANCPSCAVTTEMALYGGGRAACTVCGSSGF